MNLMEKGCNKKKLKEGDVEMGKVVRKVQKAR